MSRKLNAVDGNQVSVSKVQYHTFPTQYPVNKLHLALLRECMVELNGSSAASPRGIDT